MGKVIAAINMTVDGYCDHTAIIPDEELHDHYTSLLNTAGAIIYGRITYQLMEYWRPFVKHPSGDKAMDDFAVVIDKIPKLVFSNTLTEVEWHSARLPTGSINEEVNNLKEQTSKDILAGSRSIIVEMLNLRLIDELQICVHPVIAGGGLPLFTAIKRRIELKLNKTKTLGGGAQVLYYAPIYSTIDAII